MAFEMRQKVLFKHCDPAGIVFFPRYFEMMNDCVEIFFDRELGHPFEELHKCGAVPTAQIETRFTSPSRHGDELVLHLSLTHIGRTSAKYIMTASAGDELRFETHATLVNVDEEGRPRPWSGTILQKLKDREEPKNAP
ncbi:MAG: thioesterase family protein [Pseudomonadota bacterium]